MDAQSSVENQGYQVDGYPAVLPTDIKSCQLYIRVCPSMNAQSSVENQGSQLVGYLAGVANYQPGYPILPNCISCLTLVWMHRVA